MLGPLNVASKYQFRSYQISFSVSQLSAARRRTQVELANDVRAMKHEHVRAERQRLLSEPHIAPLVAFCRRLEAAGFGDVPMFDPLDGGVNARVLFLLEKPGPKTAPDGRHGSGFISRDNDDPSAAHSLMFHRASGLDRKETLLWNIIPWWDGTTKFSAHHRRAGIDRVRELIALLTNLDTIVLVGRTAHQAERELAGTGLRILKSWHPSMRVRNGFPEKFASIPEVWRQAAQPRSPDYT